MPVMPDGRMDLGLGLGSILCRASSVTDSMVEATAIGLSNSLSWDERALELIYPRLQRIREISAYIAVRVIRAAQAAVSCLSFAMPSTCTLIMVSRASIVRRT